MRKATVTLSLTLTMMLGAGGCATDFGTEEWATLGPLTIDRHISQNMAGDNTYTFYAYNPTASAYCVYRPGMAPPKRSVMVGPGQRVAVYSGRTPSQNFAAEAPEDLGLGPYCPMV